MIVVILLSLLQNSRSEVSYQKVTRSSDLEALRVRFFIVSGFFEENYEQTIKNQIIPSVESFYSSALKLPRIKEGLVPELGSCGDITIPEEHSQEGLGSDVIIYVYSKSNPVEAVVGRVCRQEDSVFKRPLVGYLGVDVPKFFIVPESTQMMLFLRETAHVLAVDYTLFDDYVTSEGKQYSESQRLSIINYPDRGKTVKTIGFPLMLEKARKTFDCNIEGLELEDSFSEENQENNSFFWEGRIMTHDILSSYVSSYPVFSDITLALFEDSGWYIADYSLASTLKLGFKQGCTWFEEKCIDELGTLLDGFCNRVKSYPECDAYGLGYGTCFIRNWEGIPPHEQYFSNSTLGGSNRLDFCPVLETSPLNQCRHARYKPNADKGEVKGFGSMCFMSSLLASSGLSGGKAQEFASGACYMVQGCTPTNVVLRVADQIIHCPYRSKVTVEGFSGYLHCPSSAYFCKAVPCPNLCTGRGRCINSQCLCSQGWGGEDCSILCILHCKSCLVAEMCKQCNEGYFLSGVSCSKCSDSCLECSVLESLCTACKAGLELVNGKCISCQYACASCDSPCTKCENKYYLKDGQCSQCLEPCDECDGSKCITCISGYHLQETSCIKDCIEGCSSCDFPCKICKPGFFLFFSNCKLCDNLCATCQDSGSFCTSCFDGFQLFNNTCAEVCIPHCLTCKSPCSKCEDGHFSSKGVCVSCDDSCLTCTEKAALCTSCKFGYKLVGPTCQKECDPNCFKCKSNQCEQCETGFFLDSGVCIRCAEECKSCLSFAERCTECFEGFGLVDTTCIEGCMDHCLSCDSPCTTCQAGFVAVGQVCMSCHFSCRDCEGLGDQQCIHCAEGFQKTGNLCKPICQQNCLSCDEPCSNCMTGYFQFKLACSKCSETCETCKESSSFCTSCRQGFGLVSAKCLEGCLDHCVTCDRPCSLCEEGFLFIDERCEKCHSSCKGCAGNLNNCTKCFFDYSLKDGKCRRNCVDNCKTCEFPCSSCELGFEVQDGLCKECPEGCETCSPHTGDCFSCLEGFQYGHKSCTRVCPLNCYSCDVPCRLCNTGYISLKGVCEKCLYPCTSCIETRSKCLSCPDLFTLSSYSCLSSCLPNCESCDNPCTKCLPGFHSSEEGCLTCSPDCLTCSGSADYCTSCKSGHSLSENSCKPDCIPNCLNCSNPCKSCMTNFKLLENSCVECVRYLDQSIVHSEYLTDLSGVILYFDLPLRDSAKKCSEIFKNSTLELLGADSFCHWQSETSLIVKFGLRTDYRLRILELLPLPVFGFDCDSEPHEVQLKLSTGKVRRPMVSISAPHSFSLGCGSQILEVIGRTSEKIGKFELTAKPELPILKSFMNNFEGLVIKLTESMLIPCHLNFTLTATNLIGMSSTVSSTVVVTNNRSISLAVDLGSHLRLASSNSFVVRGKVPQSSCVSTGTLSFKWQNLEVFSETTSYYNDFVEFQQTGHLLKISKNSLKTGRKYLFRITAHDGASEAFNDIQIEIVEEPLIVVIDRSDSSCSVDQVLKISAINSVDPNFPASQLKFHWECFEGVSSCLDVRGFDLLSSADGPELQVSPGRMIFGKTLLFKVTVSSGTRLGFQTVQIFTTKGSGNIELPIIARTVSTEQELAVFPVFRLTADQTELVFEWSQVSGPAVMPRTSLSLPFLIIDRETLLKGYFYRFKLTANDSESVFFSFIDWSTSIRPTCQPPEVLIDQDTVSLSVSCLEINIYEPLTYIYGIKTRSSASLLFPFAVLQVPSASFKTVTGNWTWFVEVCDSNESCLLQEISGQVSEKANSTYADYKKIPDNVPLAIFNSFASGVVLKFSEVFQDLKNFLRHQNVGLFHLKIVIECFEILTQGQKDKILTTHEEEIVEFLIGIVSKLDSVDDNAMSYVVDLFSHHQIKDYKKVSILFQEFSDKWVGKLAPGESKQLKKKIQLERLRFVGQPTGRRFQGEGFTVSDLSFEHDLNTVYDLLIISFPSDLAAIVDIQVLKVAKYQSFNYQLFNQPEKLTLDLEKPFSILFKTGISVDVDCVQLKSGSWLKEGCEVKNRLKKSVQVTSWHLRLITLHKSSTQPTGRSALILNFILLSLTVFSGLLLWYLDKQPPLPIHSNPNNSIDAAPKSLDQNVKELELKEEPSPRLQFPKSSAFSKLLNHPTLNIMIRQPGDRRIFSSLHLNSVLFCEFISAGFLFSPYFGENFDEKGDFLSFSWLQIFSFSIGLILSQGLSIGLTYLNRLKSFKDLKKMKILVSVLILLLSGVGFALGYMISPPCSKFWCLLFVILALSEFLVFETLLFLWCFYCLNSSVESSITMNSRNVRVFTTEP